MLPDTDQRGAAARHSHSRGSRQRQGSLLALLLRRADNGRHMKLPLAVLDGRSKVALLAAATVTIVAVGALERMAPSGVSLAPFYFLPVLLAAWWLDAWSAFVVSLLASFVWLAGSMSVADAGSPATWINLAVRLAALVLLSFVTGALRHHVDAARTDASTGLLNEAGFRERASAEAYRARRYERTLTVACIEVDGFRALTSRFGRATGEAVVRSMAHTLAGRIRASDVLAHLGADRFALLLPETAAESARIALEQFHVRLTEAVSHSRWPVTLSLGAATFEVAPESADALLLRADDCLRAARAEGPGRLRHEVVAKEPPAEATAEVSSGA